MRALAETTVIIALVGCIAAFTLVSIVSAFEASVAVTFTTFGTDDDLFAGDWALCDALDAVTCQ
jgi:hypothetical protein